MIERMGDMPAGTLGFRVSGVVERDDYVDRGPGRARAGALWADSKLGFDLEVRHRAELEQAKAWVAG